MGFGIRRRIRDLSERWLSYFALIPMVPSPNVALGVGHGDFTAVGNEFLGHLVRFGGLLPDHRVLDVGCGVGRMAVPLTNYLTQKGRYRGFDVTPDAIAWCRNRITPRFPNFRFEWADLHNHSYNPAGLTRACDYVFPYADAEFDFVFLTSVFTHMVPDDLSHFLDEISRVLKPGGRCFATFFLLNQDSERAIATGQSTLPFGEEFAGCRVQSLERPEDAIAYPEARVRANFERVGMPIREPIVYGAWSGQASPGSAYQDIVVADKDGHRPSV